MRRIYIPIILMMLIFAFYGGYKLGQNDPEAPKALTAVRQQRDILSSKLMISKAREKRLEILALNAGRKVKRADSAIVAEKKRSALKDQKHQKEITRLKTATPEQLDTALQERYKTPRYSFNQSLRQISMPEWRVREIAIDLVRMDSLTDLANGHALLEEKYKVAITDRDTVIDLKDQLLQQKDSSFAVIEQREGTHIAEGLYWQKEAKKYKRQRNGLIAGVGTAAGVVGYFVVKSLLKR